MLSLQEPDNNLIVNFCSTIIPINYTTYKMYGFLVSKEFHNGMMMACLISVFVFGYIPHTFDMIYYTYLKLT